MLSITPVSSKRSGVMPSDSYILIRSSTLGFFLDATMELAIEYILSFDDEYLSDSICIIVLISFLCSLSSGYIGFNCSICRSITSCKSSFQPKRARSASVLLNIILRLYPPPTFDGNEPSEIANNNVLVWSAIIDRVSNGRTIFSISS